MKTKEGKVREVESTADWESSLKEKKMIVVDFSAVWCGPCRMISPYFVQLSEEAAFKDIIFLKIDVDEVGEVAEKAGISAMPTFQVWKDGQKVDELVGASKEKLKELIQKHA
ncbi:hypothetical protein WJX73_007940 [Symbiochloris irregularis]|uniref:Thioredoxin n=1 Tax=Symbiochloris irregularis TaxID=706552 RepID=A0AAW1PAG2_9CHLO